jgi:hypothetical protein
LFWLHPIRSTVAADRTNALKEFVFIGIPLNSRCRQARGYAAAAIETHETKKEAGAIKFRGAKDTVPGTFG